MRRLLIALSLVAATAASAGAAPACDRLVETTWLNADGSGRIEIEVQCPSGTTSPLAVPVAVADLGSLTIEGVAGAGVSSAEADGPPRLLIRFPGTLTTPATFHVTGRASRVAPAFGAPPESFGDRKIQYRFANVTPTRFGSITARIVLPQGFVVSAIDSAAPSTPTGSPVTLTAIDGRHTVVVALDHVGLGATASVAFRCRARSTRPVVMPLLLIVLAAIYLTVFRDLPGKQRMSASA